MTRHVLIKKWLSLAENEGKVLLNIQRKRLNLMNGNEVGSLCEEVAVEVLRKLGYSDLIMKHSFYDIEATKKDEKYYFEIKGRKWTTQSYVTSQKEALEKLKKSGKKVCWIFATLMPEGSNIAMEWSIEEFYP